MKYVKKEQTQEQIEKYNQIKKESKANRRRIAKMLKEETQLL